jgi:uncharacterized Tic20 family protein
VEDRQTAGSVVCPHCSAHFPAANASRPNLFTPGSAPGDSPSPPPRSARREEESDEEDVADDEYECGPGLPREDDFAEDEYERRRRRPSSDEKQWAMFAQLAALGGLFVVGFTFIGPLIVWLIKKDESRFVDHHGREALNFHLNILIYYLITLTIAIATCGVLFPLPLAVLVYSIVMTIIAGIKANEGEWYKYPLTFRLIN